DVSSPEGCPMYTARSLAPRALIAGLCLFLNVLPVSAQSSSWSAGNGNWSTAANWQGGVVANGANNTATFDTAVGFTPVFVTLDTSRTIGNLVFDNPNNVGWTIGGTTTLTLSNTTQP